MCPSNQNCWFHRCMWLCFPFYNFSEWPGKFVALVLMNLPRRSYLLSLRVCLGADAPYRLSFEMARGWYAATLLTMSLPRMIIWFGPHLCVRFWKLLHNLKRKQSTLALSTFSSLTKKVAIKHWDFPIHEVFNYRCLFYILLSQMYFF